MPLDQWHDPVGAVRLPPLAAISRHSNAVRWPVHRHPLLLLLLLLVLQTGGVSGAARAIVQAGAKNCGIATTGHVTGTPRIACLNLGDRWAGSVCVYVLCVYVRLCVCVALATDTKTSCDLPSISFM